VRDCHELGECRPSQESIVHSLKLYVLRAKVFLSPEGQGKEDLANGCCYCPRDYAMKGSPTRMQQGPGQPHLVEGLQEQNVKGSTSIDKDSG
jgi:hypothetical protein